MYAIFGIRLTNCRGMQNMLIFVFLVLVINSTLITSNIFNHSLHGLRCTRCIFFFPGIYLHRISYASAIIIIITIRTGDRVAFSPFFSRNM